MLLEGACSGTVTSEDLILTTGLVVVVVVITDSATGPEFIDIVFDYCIYTCCFDGSLFVAVTIDIEVGYAGLTGITSFNYWLDATVAADPAAPPTTKFEFALLDS